MNQHADRKVTTSQEQQTQSLRHGGSVEAKAVRVILSNFWVDRDPEVEALEVATWLRVLKGVSPQRILDAWSDYDAKSTRNGNGRLSKPTPHDIRTRAMRLRKQEMEQTARQIPYQSAPIIEHREHKVAPDVAERIMQEAGFTKAHTDLVKRFPRAASRQDMQDKSDVVASEPHWTYSATPEQLDQLKRARKANPLMAESMKDAQ